MLGRSVVEHGRAEGIDEHLLSAIERVTQLVRAQTPAGDGLRQLAEIEVLHEGDCLEVMDPAAHAQALYPARRTAATILASSSAAARLITCADGSWLREAFGGVGAGDGIDRGRRSPL